jgi:hypothetical protein
MMWLTAPFVALLALTESAAAADIYRDCTRDLYDRVVRFEYLYYEVKPNRDRLNVRITWLSTLFSRRATGCIRTTSCVNTGPAITTRRKNFVSPYLTHNMKKGFASQRANFYADSANDMNTNAYKSAIHKVHERTIYETSNALAFYVRECGGGWACLEARHKDW